MPSWNLFGIFATLASAMGKGEREERRRKKSNSSPLECSYYEERAFLLRFLLVPLNHEEPDKRAKSNAKRNHKEGQEEPKGTKKKLHKEPRGTIKNHCSSV